MCRCTSSAWPKAPAGERRDRSARAKTGPAQIEQKHRQQPAVYQPEVQVLGSREPVEGPRVHQRMPSRTGRGSRCARRGCFHPGQGQREVDPSIKIVALSERTGVPAEVFCTSPLEAISVTRTSSSHVGSKTSKRSRGTPRRLQRNDEPVGRRAEAGAEDLAIGVRAARVAAPFSSAAVFLPVSS